MIRAQRWIWLAAFAAAGVALAWLYPDSYQQDGGYHYLFARAGWKHPEIFVGVWARPLFSLLYSFPAAFGYPAAKLFTLCICLLTAYQTCRLAEDLRLERPAFVIPLLFLQPSFALMSADTMTEPLFGLLLVVALRLHHARRVALGALVASLLILARPEGFFLAALWGVWILRDDGRWQVWRTLPRLSLLATGALLWWVAAYLLTGDPLYIKHNWPAGWEVTSAANGIGNLWVYGKLLPEIVGPLLSVPFVIGLLVLLVQRRLGTVTSSFLVVFVLHSILRAFGLFGSAGYARYFVCVSPAIAIITLSGWHDLGRWFAWLPRAVRIAAATATIAVSVIVTTFYIDAQKYTRDARAVTEMYGWFQRHARPVERVIWSQAYMCILFDGDVWLKPSFGGDKAANLEMLRTSPPGTLIFWDADTGPSWFHMTADDFEGVGYERLRSEAYQLPGLITFKQRWWFFDWGPRPQQMHLFYKGR